MRRTLAVLAGALALASLAACTSGAAPGQTTEPGPATPTSSAGSDATTTAVPPAPTDATTAEATTAATTTSTATDTSTEPDTEVAVATPAEPLPLDQLAKFSGVATMNAGSNCTGTLIDTGVPEGPAYVLTNGHCVGDVGRSAQRTTLDQEWFGTAEFLRAQGNVHDDAYGTTKNDTLIVDVVQLTYSTMRQTDTGIVRLTGTLRDLENKGIKPVVIAAAEPTTGEKVVNIGVPVEGLAADQWVMRRGDCTLDRQHTVLEFTWLWYGVWSNNCPGIIQGSSGSPLLTTDAAGAPDRIVAMINTTSWGASSSPGSACAIHHPCEVGADGVTVVPKTSYAQSVAGIGGCFDRSTGVFAIGDACPLPVSSVWAENGGGSFRGGDLPDAVGRTPSVELVGSSAGTVRTALTELGDGKECLQPETYRQASSRPLPAFRDDFEKRGLELDVKLPEVAGRYLYCAARGDDYAGAASVQFEVDRTAPTIKAAADVEDMDGTGALVRPHLDPPEITTVRFNWGPKGSVDCTDTGTFQDFFIVPLFIEAADLPATYCLYGMDAAGNQTPVTTIDIPAG